MYHDEEEWHQDHIEEPDVMEPQAPGTDQQTEAGHKEVLRQPQYWKNKKYGGYDDWINELNERLY